MDWERWGELLFLIGLFLNVAGLVIPLYPAFLVMWLMGLGYLLAMGLEAAHIAFFAVFTLLALLGMLADNLLAGWGAARGGASPWVIGLALLVGLAATFLWPPLGGCIAMPLTVLLVETLRRQSLTHGWQALRGWLAGWGWALVVRVVLGLAMVGVWVLWALYT